MARRPTHIRKLCMVMSASRSSDLVIEEEDFVRAEKALTSAEVSMTKAFGGLGKSDYTDAAETVIDFIQQRGVVTRSELLKVLWRDLDPMVLKTVDTIVTQMKIVRIKILADKGDQVYEWLGK